MFFKTSPKDPSYFFETLPLNRNFGSGIDFEAWSQELVTTRSDPKELNVRPRFLKWIEMSPVSLRVAEENIFFAVTIFLNSLYSV